MSTSITVYGNRRQQITSALTQWDERQRLRDRQHNPRFLGIALQAFEDIDDSEIESDPRSFILDHFTGRCAEFILKALSLAPMTKSEDR